MMPANQNRRVYIYAVDEEAFFAQRLQADDFSLEQQLIERLLSAEQKTDGLV